MADKAQNPLGSESPVFRQLQLLKEFVDFISHIDEASSEDRPKAEEIKYLIDHIQHLKAHKAWQASLDIFDPEIKEGSTAQGFYWRKWSVFFENERLEITAESNHTADPIGHYGNDFHYYGGVYFGRGNIDQNYLGRGLDGLIRDVKNYKKYITASLNHVEVDIEVY